MLLGQRPCKASPSTRRGLRLDRAPRLSSPRFGASMEDPRPRRRRGREGPWRAATRAVCSALGKPRYIDGRAVSRLPSPIRRGHPRLRSGNRRSGPRPAVFAQTLARAGRAPSLSAICDRRARADAAECPPPPGPPRADSASPTRPSGSCPDPAYNATLGSAHLAELIEDLGRSYISPSPPTNAGRRRRLPLDHPLRRPPRRRRRPDDLSRWISYTQQHNYVQNAVMENFQGPNGRPPPRGDRPLAVLRSRTGGLG